MPLGPGDISVGRLLGQLVLETKDWDQGLDNSEKKIKKFGLSSLSFLGAWAKRVTAVVVATVVAITYKTAKFESAVKRTVSVLGKGYDEIAAAAREMGADTIYSASQAADAMYNLASAGLSVEETVTAVKDALNLAAATGRSMSDATYLIAGALKQFGLEAEDSTRVVDVYTASIHNSFLNAERLREGMKYVGSAARGFGWDIEHATTSLAMFTNLGLEGGLAARHLVAAMGNLAKPTKEARAYIQDLGLSLDEVNPYLHSMDEIIKTLAESGFEAAKSSTIFARAAAGNMSALIAQFREGKMGYADLEQKLRDSAGTGAKAYEMMTDTITGAFKKLGSALEALALEVGENWRDEAKAVILEAGDAVTKFVEAAKKAGPEIKATAQSITPVLLQFLKWAGTLSEYLGTAAKAMKEIVTLARQTGRLVLPDYIRTSGLRGADLATAEEDIKADALLDRMFRLQEQIDARRYSAPTIGVDPQATARDLVVLENKLAIVRAEYETLMHQRIIRRELIEMDKGELATNKEAEKYKKVMMLQLKVEEEAKNRLLRLAKEMHDLATAEEDDLVGDDEDLAKLQHFYERKEAEERRQQEAMYDFRVSLEEQLAGEYHEGRIEIEDDLGARMLAFVHELNATDRKERIESLLAEYEKRRALAKAQLDEEAAIRQGQMQLMGQMLGGLMRDFMGGATSIAGSFASTLQNTMGRAMGGRMTGMGGMGWGAGGGGNVMGLAMPRFADAAGVARAPTLGESLFSRPSMLGSRALGGGIMGYAMTGDSWGAVGGAIGGPLGSMVASFIHTTLGRSRVTTDQRQAAAEYEQTIERLRANQTQARDYVNNLLQGINEGTIQASDDRVSELLNMAREIEGYDIPDVNLVMNSSRRGGLRGLAGGRNVEYYIGNQGDVDEALEALEGMYGEFGEMFENVEGTAEFNRQTGSPFVGSGNYVVNNATLNVGTMVTNDNKRMIDEAADMFLDSLLSRGRLTAGVTG